MCAGSRGTSRAGFGSSLGLKQRVEHPRIHPFPGLVCRVLGVGFRV